MTEWYARSSCKAGSHDEHTAHELERNLNTYESQYELWALYRPG
jgi:hypothetical protein